jgi:hypothetical protein
LTKTPFAARPPAWARQSDPTHTAARGCPAVLDGAGAFEAAAGWHADGSFLAAEAWGGGYSTPRDGPAAFAYLYRRFGPPAGGCDPVKELARYYLDTPDPGVVLTLTLGPTWARPGYGISPAVRAACERPLVDWEERFRDWHAGVAGTRVGGVCVPADVGRARVSGRVSLLASRAVGAYPVPPVTRVGGWREAPPAVAAANRCLLDAIHELLRPVRVRDVSFNILGRCDHRPDPDDQ